MLRRWWRILIYKVLMDWLKLRDRQKRIILVTVMIACTHSSTIVTISVELYSATELNGSLKAANTKM